MKHPAFSNREPIVIAPGRIDVNELDHQIDTLLELLDTCQPAQQKAVEGTLHLLLKISEQANRLA